MALLSVIWVIWSQFWFENIDEKSPESTSMSLELSIILSSMTELHAIQICSAWDINVFLVEPSHVDTTCLFC